MSSIKIVYNDQIDINEKYRVLLLDKNRKKIGNFKWSEVQDMSKKAELDIVQIHNNTNTKVLVAMLIDYYEFLSLIKQKKKKQKKNKNIKIFKFRDRITQFDLNYRIKRINSLVNKKKCVIKVIYKIYKYKNTTNEENRKEFQEKFLNKIATRNYKINILKNKTIIVLIYNSKNT